MNTILKRKLFAIVSLFAMLFVASSCVDNEGLVVTPEAPNADKTLYEVIMNDPELTSFVEILNACNIPSAKNVNDTVSVLDSLFNTSRVYTVWAPVNDCLKYIKDSIIQRINAGYREDVMNTFVASHVANFLKDAQGRFDKDGEYILMLNDKKMLFEGSYDKGYTFDGNKLTAWNNRAKNGIIHKLETVAKYQYNIWEYIKIYSETADLYKVDSLVNYLYSYNDTVFSEYLSIPGPLVNGEETYLDSVFTYENDMLTKYGGVGELDIEDSTFIFYLPTNKAWNDIMAQAVKHFDYSITPNYIGEKIPSHTDSALVDSLEFNFPRRNIIKYLTYSDNEQKFVKSKDSIMPLHSENPRKLFKRADIDKHVVYTKELSNGTLKVVDEFPYTQFDLWHDTIRIEAENLTYLNTAKTTDKNFITRYTAYKDDINKNAGTKVSGSQYIQYCNKTNDYVSLCYYVPDVKAATYKVLLVMVPSNIKKDIDTTAEQEKPIELACGIYSYDPVKKENNHELLFVEEIQPAHNRIDTIELGKVTFPTCEYEFTEEVKQYSAQIMIDTQSSTKRYTNTIRMDAILFIPVEDAK